MKNLNPTAFVLFALGAIVGYLANGVHGALVGLAVTLGISFLASVFL